MHIDYLYKQSENINVSKNINTYIYKGKLNINFEEIDMIFLDNNLYHNPIFTYYLYDEETNTTEFRIEEGPEPTLEQPSPTVELPTEYDTLMLYTAQFVVTDDVALTISDIYPEWSADSVAYKLNEKVRYNDLLYKCLTAHTSQASWTPTDAPSLWVRIDDPAEEWPEWRQPTGSTDAYAKGAKVAHNSKHWVSNVDNNTWEPGVYGWDEQTDTSAS